MFFLGISAHLFIYLLVPAFLVVCLYFRGTSGSPEMITLSPETITYEYTIRSYTEKDYIYQVRKQREIIKRISLSFPDFTIASPFLFFPAIFYCSPVFLHKALRAPPVGS